MSRLNRLCLVWFLLASVPCAQAQRRYRAVPDPQSPPEIPYTRYFTRDRFDRRITFYIHGNQRDRLPLVVAILGSGAYSNFLRSGEQILDGHRTAREVFSRRAHIVIVEKPGVEFLEQHDDPGKPLDASAQYIRENTLERWAEAVSAALRAAHSLPLADPSRCLLVGHSEGGIVAARVAAENQFVTHVATLSATGPPLLFELMHKAREARLYPSLPPDPDQQVARLLADVAAVQADPSNWGKFVLGHPHPYWSSRWPFSTIGELSRTRARLFIAHGTADRNVSIANFDVLYANLLALGKDVTARRYEGADHAYRFAEQPERDGWRELFEALRAWFFEQTGS